MDPHLEDQPLRKVEVSASFSSTAGFGQVGWSKAEEETLVNKFDRHILPGLSVLYLLCFLDRTYVEFWITSNYQGISGMQGKLSTGMSLTKQTPGIRARLGNERERLQSRSLSILHHVSPPRCKHGF